MRKWLVFFFLLALLILPTPASAQGGIKLKAINIELWPEYDRPSMLVIHQFIVDQSVALPVEVTVRFPEDGNLTAVASLVNNSLVNIGYEGPEVQGDWQIVKLKVESYAPHRIEYYQPLARENNIRKFSFLWFGDHATDEFSIAVQYPLDSTNVVADPPFSSTVQAKDGLHFIGMVTRTNLKMGQSFEFNIEYERESEAMTQSEIGSGIQPSETVGPETEGRVSIDNLPWIIGGFGLALIGLALFFYWRSTQAPEHKTRQRKRTGTSQETVEEQAYCHECGTRAQKGDRFCRTCGSRLRV